MSFTRCFLRPRFAIFSAAFVALTLPLSAPAQNNKAVKIEEKVTYLGTPNNIRMSNGTVELILTTDYGPRIMRYAFVGSGEADNLFGTVNGPTTKTELGDWYIRGGHRLWFAPENMPFTYEPDNDPIQYKIEGNTVRLIQPVEKHTRLQKEMAVTLDPQGTRVVVTHKITNRGLGAMELACWALTVMNTGGLGIFPQEPYGSHAENLLPVRPMVLWAYTNLADPRWMWGKQFFTLRHDPKNKEPQKVGVLNRQGWAAYLRNNTLFLKRFAFEPDKTYPDYGCNMETFTNDAILEVETLGPLVTLKSGQSAAHTEAWWLFRKVEIGSGETGLAAAMLPILTETGRH